ncbi:MAG: hypothetical protein LC643_08135, partial [Bacteroidales bacterium]|nr:hypothetical protein [Bacteroidales bacterium]
MSTSFPFRQFAFVLLSASLLSFIPSSNEWHQDIIRKLSAYQVVNRQEKLFVQTDRPVYVAGENVWFSAFLLEAASHRLNQSEQVIYVELVKPNGSIADKRAFKLDQGRAEGALFISERAEGGNYLFMAYTNWMRNAGSAFYFRKSISIVGKEELAVIEDESQAGDKRSSLTEDVNASVIEAPVELSFYPEGGHMVQGLPCRLAFEGTGLSGGGWFGNVMDDQGELITSFTPMWEQKGILAFVPDAGRSYFAEVSTSDGELHRFALPQAQDGGLTLNVEDVYGSAELLITINGAAETDGALPFYLLGVQRGVPKAGVHGTIEDHPVAFKLDKASFSKGVAQLTLFSRGGIPVCERLVYIHQKQEVALDIRVGELTGKPRQHVEVEFQTRDKTGKAVTTDLVVSVTDALRIPDEMYTSDGLSQYLAFSSDLPDYRGDKSIFFEHSRMAALKRNLVMMTNGWRRYTWDEVLVDTLDIPDYLEEPGLYVTGTVYRSASEKTAPAGTQVTLVSDNYSQLCFTDIGEDGKFTFILKDFKGPLKAVIQTKNKRSNRMDYDIALTTNIQNSSSGAYTRLYDDSKDTKYDMRANQNSGIQIDSLIRDYLVSGVSFQIEDQLEISSDVLLNEVTVAGARLQSNKQKMTEMFGEPQALVDDRQLSQLVEEKPWHFGLMSILMDACPGLYVDVRQSSMEYVSGGSFGGGVNDNMYQSDAASVLFRLKNERRHRFFIYVDGRIVGATDDKGVLSRMLGLYQIDELISMDPEIVESVELLVPEANKKELYS